MRLRYDSFLRTFDASIVEALREEMVATGISLHPNSQGGKSIVKDPSTGKLTLSVLQGEPIADLDCIIWATGRTPLLPEGLSSAGVELNEQGFIRVDEWQNTTGKGIYAVGDVTGAAALTPVAIAAGRKLAERLFNKDMPHAKQDFTNIPSVVFSHPPIATVGLTEAEARKEHEKIKIYSTKFAGMDGALNVGHRPKTVMKLICAGDNEKVI